MANYFLNSDGSINTKKKTAGNHYRLEEDGKVSLMNNTPSSASTLNDYQKRKKELEKQLLNYKREEANPWWDKNDNVVENVGNVFHKLFFEKPEDRYKKDEQYDALEKEYADINKKIDDYLVENKKYDKGLLGYAQKSADVTAGNVRTSVDGINSTILKATGQKPIVYDSYAERIGNKAISQSKGAEKVGLEITGSVARMVPQMIMPTKKASYIMGFANYGGSAYNQAKKEGYDEDKATLYGMTIGGLEMGLQGLLGGLDDIYGSSIAGRATDKIMRKIISNPTVRSYITKVGGEFTEEYLQEFLNPIVRNVILEEENGADFWNQAGIENKIKRFAKNFFNEQNLYAGALGGLTSGIMDSPALFVNKTNSNSVSTKPTVPTVQEVVAQENTKKEQGTGFSTVASSFNEEANLPSSQSELLMDKSTSNTNNITQSNDSVNLSSKNDSNIFSRQLDELLAGTFNKNNHLTVLQHTPNILQELGVKDYPITLTTNKLDRILNASGNQKGEYHNLGLELVKQLPEALQRPLDIIKSHNNSYVLTTDLIDNQNRQIIASIKIDGKGYINDIKVDTNVMTSAYGRNNYDNWMNKHQKEGNIVYDIDRGYLNKKRDSIQGLQLSNETISSQEAPTGLPIDNQLRSRFVEQPVSDNNIPQINENVKLPMAIA